MAGAIVSKHRIVAAIKRLPDLHDCTETMKLPDGIFPPLAIRPQ